MPVQLLDGKVLLDSGLVAIDPACCCGDCLVSFSCVVGCAGGSVGQPDQSTAWSAALADWDNCTVQPFSCSEGNCFSIANPRAQSTSTRASATINTCGTRFTLDSSPVGFANVSGMLRTYDGIVGLVDETPFSFTLTGIGDFNDIVPMPIEPADPGPFPASNTTYTNIEDVGWEC